MHQLAIIVPLLVLMGVFFVYGPKLKLHLNFRKAYGHEAQSLKELSFTSYSAYKTVLQPEHWETLKTNLSDEKMWDQLLGSSTAFVCENNNTIIGMALLVSSGHPTEIYPSDCSYIRMLAVHPDFTRKGIAKKLAEMCITEARKSGERTIKLHTSEFMDAARHLYEKLGFKIEKQIPDIFGKKYWLYNLDL